MSKDTVQYKTLSPGCFVDVQTLPPDHLENRIIGGDRRRSRPSAGLIVEAETPFPVGGLVLVDLKFPGQSVTYRSQGIVSWVVDNRKTDRPFKMGVLIFGMDKLDANGVSLSIAAPSPIPVDTDPLPGHLASTPSAGAEHPAASPPLDQPLFADTSSEEKTPLPSAEPLHSSPETDAQSTVGDGISVCAADWKITNWLSKPQGVGSGQTDETLFKPQHLFDDVEISQTVFLPPEDTRPNTELSQTAPGAHLTESDFNDLEFHLPEHTEGPHQQGLSLDVSALHSFAREDQEIVVEVDVAEGFDAEGKMIEAFERMHEMYLEGDRDGVARFTRVLTRDLILCEEVRVLLISAEKFELYAAAGWGSGGGSEDQLTRPVTGGVAGFAIQTGTPIRVPNADTDPIFDGALDGLNSFDTANLMAVPIHYHGHTIGVIELRNSPRKGGFVQGEADIVSYIAAAMADYMYTSLPVNKPI
ncbi:MAG: GAF domain-containing protein [Myxococcota bacterium]|nr:GAF domain-containing protein [Myxococcota bacterium]